MQKDLLADFLHLYHSLEYGNRNLARLLGYFDGDPRRARTASRSKLAAIGVKSAAITAITARQHPRVARDLGWAESDRNHLVCFDDEDYPALLRQIDDFPALLYARGDPGLLQQPQIAIVGSRRCTPGGAQTATEFAETLAGAGLTITSGLALGIDADAHRGALQCGGKTLAVLGTGIDVIYPARNRKIADAILDRGLIITEFAPGSRAQPANFPRRNRIISGLALATLVVEAAQRSGSLITAGLAAEQGREVFAVPGSINNPLTRGCHQLIQDGATLVETPGDITRELASLFGFVFAQQSRDSAGEQQPLDREQSRLLQAIGYDPVNCDILVRRSGLTIDKVSSMLVELELNDLIQSAPGGCFVRI